jgi:hypothetical protein
MEQFDNIFRMWVDFACKEWDYPNPSEYFFKEAYYRLPEGLRVLIVDSIEKGLIIPEQFRFRLKGQKFKKLYSWLGKKPEKSIQVYWEYFIQVAEYVRLYNILDLNKYNLIFETDNMDICIFLDDKLIVYGEAKEKPGDIFKLIEGIEFYGRGISIPHKKRNDDALNKSHNIIKYRPNYFYIFSNELIIEYNLTYPDEKLFELKEETIPILS